MFGLGVPEIIVIGIIILLIFGAKRIPGIGEGLGKTIKELRNAKEEISGSKELEAKKEIGESKESEKNEGIAGGETAAPENQSSEGDLVDAVQKKVTKQVTDKLLGQVPGIKQVRQLKDKADKIKKIVS